MLPLVFIGGAITGAAALLGAALYDHDKTEAHYPASLENTAGLDKKEVCALLNDYYIKENALATKCSQLVMECSNCYPAIEMPDENFAEKAFRMADNLITPTIRKWNVQQMLDLKEEAKKLYSRYKGTFRRANQLLKERGHTPLDLNEITFRGVDFSINNAGGNENWVFELIELSDKIRAFLDKSGDIAEKMIQLLDGKKATLAIEAA